jgi:hypothetical protein
MITRRPSEDVESERRAGGPDDLTDRPAAVIRPMMRMTGGTIMGLVETLR